jgi:very-short-patch-repair endonuclease
VLPRRDDASQVALTAVAASLAWPGAVISHESAAVVHGLPARVLPRVAILTVVRNSVTGRRSDIHARRAALGDRDIGRWFGARVTWVPRTVTDLARHDRIAGLMAADSALREQQCTRAELDASASACAGWPGSASARWVAYNADAQSESPLESWTRAIVIDAGLPAPELQVRIQDPVDGWHCRVDMLWREQRVVLEADGKIKYASATARGNELWAEKRRQERLERLGYRVVRVLWDDLERHPAQTIARIQHALRRRLLLSPR